MSIWGGLQIEYRDSLDDSEISEIITRMISEEQMDREIVERDEGYKIRQSNNLYQVFKKYGLEPERYGLEPESFGVVHSPQLRLTL